MTLDKSIDNLRRPQARVIREVFAAFERADVGFVLLHGHDPEAPDSDLNVVVTRRSLGAVGALVRAGTFGRILQRFQYDVPWFYTYVIEQRASTATIDPDAHNTVRQALALLDGESS